MGSYLNIRLLLATAAMFSFGSASATEIYEQKYNPNSLLSYQSYEALSCKKLTNVQNFSDEIEKLSGLQNLVPENEYRQLLKSFYDYYAPQIDKLIIEIEKNIDSHINKIRSGKALANHETIGSILKAADGIFALLSLHPVTATAGMVGGIFTGSLDFSHSMSKPILHKSYQIEGDQKFNEMYIAQQVGELGGSRVLIMIKDKQPLSKGLGFTWALIQFARSVSAAQDAIKLRNDYKAAEKMLSLAKGEIKKVKSLKIHALGDFKKDGFNTFFQYMAEVSRNQSDAIEFIIKNSRKNSCKIGEKKVSILKDKYFNELLSPIIKRSP